MTALLKVALVAISLSLDVFAVCVGVGVRSMTRAERIRIGLAFASAEVSMNLIGAGLGAVAGRYLGGVASYLGFAALFGLGIYMIVEGFEEEKRELDLSTGWGLFIAAVSISLDSLGIGFSLFYIGVPVVMALIAIFVVSIIATALGLALGRQIGVRVGGASAIAAGTILAATGLGFAALRFFGIGV